MNDERKIETEEVEGVAPPPRARVDESVTETFERKRDYLAGFLAETKPAPDPSTPGGALYDSVIEALKSIFACRACSARRDSISGRVVEP